MSTIEFVPIPGPDRNTLFPPNRQHNFFATAEAAPFEANAQEFSWANACWLAEAALLSYDDPEHVARHFESIGFELPGVQPLHGDGSTQCYVAVNLDVIIVAFRGTEVLLRSSSRGLGVKGVDVIRDLLVNAEVGAHEFADGGWAHRGFVRGLDEVLESQLKPLLARYGIGRRLWLTGHSLGGALATVATRQLEHIAGTYTFGAPRVGDMAFGRSLNAPLWRFSNSHDVVPTVPPAQPDPRLRWIPPGYVHSGHAIHFSDDDVLFDRVEDAEPPALLSEVLSAVSDISSTWARVKSAFEEEGTATLASIGSAGQDWRLLRDGLLNHAPLFYVLKTRNALALSRGAEAHSRVPR